MLSNRVAVDLILRFPHDLEKVRSIQAVEGFPSVLRW